MKKLFTIVFILISATAFCQLGGMSISPSGSAPDPSAILDLNTYNKGFLMPRISQAQRDAIGSPALGLLIYDTTTKCVEMFGFQNWQTISCLCSGPPASPASITGNNNPCANAASVTYSVGLVLTATSYSWTVPSGATIIAGQGTNSITVNFGVNPGSVAVTANNSCGNSSATTLPVTMNSIPGTPAVITGNPYPCANSNAQAYSIPADSGATSYTWSVPSGSIVTAGQGTTSVLINFSTTPGNLAVTANNTCGSSTASVLPISMALTPSTPGTIGGPDSFSNNLSGIQYFITPVTEATTYTWTVPADAMLTSGQGTDSITVTFGSGNGTICVAAGNCAGTSSSNCLAVTNTCYIPGAQTFTNTGAMQTFTVPCGASSINIMAYGAQGYSGSGNNGGYGGSATGTLKVTPDSLLYVFVGGQNGYNGGGTGNYNGGGQSDVRQGGTQFANWIIVAGGGGGGSNEGATGGAGGGGFVCANGAGGGGGSSADAGTGSAGTCTIGGAAGSPNGGWSGGGGGGGLTSGGLGTANDYSYTAGSGTQGVGGNYGANNSCGCCGASACGGGGGYYGGGGTSTGQCASGCGGGGSSWASSSLTNLSFAGGVQAGDGKVVISW